MIRTYLTFGEEGFLQCPKCKVNLRYECNIHWGRLVVFGLNCDKCGDEYMLKCKEKGSPSPSQKK